MYSTNPTVLYFANTVLDPELISSIENDVNCNFEICRSLSDIVAKINSDESSVSPTVVLFDHNAIEQHNITIPEMVGTLQTLQKCICFNRINIGIVVTNTCNPFIIKQFKKTDILGVVPLSEKFNYMLTVESIRGLVNSQPTWPKAVIQSSTPAASKVQCSAEGLTPRQRQVLQLVCNRGLSNKKIASALNIAESTVKIHISAILKSFGVRNRTQLALAARSAFSA